MPTGIYSRANHQRGYTLDKTTGCWNWHGSINAYGYGRMLLSGKEAKAHRIAWEKAYGPIPSGLCVLHTCDNRRCVNPEHLFLGTKGDNNSDRKVKGRNADRRGEKNPLAKLGWPQVRAIRNLSQSGTKNKMLVKVFGVSEATVRSVISHKTWGEPVLIRKRKS